MSNSKVHSILNWFPKLFLYNEVKGLVLPLRTGRTRSSRPWVEKGEFVLQANSSCWTRTPSSDSDGSPVQVPLQPPAQVVSSPVHPYLLVTDWTSSKNKIHRKRERRKSDTTTPSRFTLGAPTGRSVSKSPWTRTHRDLPVSLKRLH